jgi:hypothetical protein
MFSRKHGLAVLVIALVSSVCLLSAPEDEQVILPVKGAIAERPFFASRRHPAIDYDRQSTDVVDPFVRKVNDGTIKLRWDKDNGYLSSILEGLKMPIESQALVFSKTSLQGHYITPKNPRAIYFTDEVSVAFIRNATLLEISAQEPQLGVVFYAIVNQQTTRPEIARSDSCLSCHETQNSMYIPGMLDRSVGTGTGGEVMSTFGNFLSDHRSPFEQRWGGWFITGKTGTERHLGNVMLEQSGTPSSPPTGIDSLAGKMDLAGYPSPYSDVAAVMVLNHQVGMTNLLTRVGWETRVALDQKKKDPQESATADRLIASDANELADYILFADEPALHGKFESTSGFQQMFEAGGIRDKKGRSLKQLDLTKRLMRYPCSYMIYSRAFDQLPDATRNAVYSRMWEILSGKDKTAKYTRWTAADRAAAVGILLETKPNLPSYFKPLN